MTLAGRTELGWPSQGEPSGADPAEVTQPGELSPTDPTGVNPAGQTQADNPSTRPFRVTGWEKIEVK